MISRRTFLAVVPIGCAAPSLVKAASIGSSTGKMLQDAVDEYVRAVPQAAGVSAGIIVDGKIDIASGGTTIRGKAVRPGPTTIYHIASITKTFTATLLAQAATEGRLHLGDDVRAYLPGDFPNLVFAGEPVRLWHLVNHNSGLPFRLPDVPEIKPPFPAPTRAVLQSLRAYSRQDFFSDLRKVVLSAKPGTGFSYSNTAATLLSYILEELYHLDFATLLRRKITGPLGMRDTVISLSPAQARRLAPGYDERRVRLPNEDYPPSLGAGALCSTVEDLLKYARWHLAEENAAVRLTHRPHPIQGNFAVGLNWQMMQKGDRRRIWQDGTLPGYAAMCLLLPHARAGFVAFANELDPKSFPMFEKMTTDIALAIDPTSKDLF